MGEVDFFRQLRPGRQTPRPGAVYAVDAGQRDAAQDEGRHAGREIQALRHAASRDNTAVTGGGAGIGEVAPPPHRSRRPAFAGQRFQARHACPVNDLMHRVLSGIRSEQLPVNAAT
jgi:hypothetical protein